MCVCVLGEGVEENWRGVASNRIGRAGTRAEVVNSGCVKMLSKKFVAIILVMRPFTLFFAQVNRYFFLSTGKSRRVLRP